MQSTIRQSAAWDSSTVSQASRPLVWQDSPMRSSPAPKLCGRLEDIACTSAERGQASCIRPQLRGGAGQNNALSRVDPLRLASSLTAGWVEIARSRAVCPALISRGAVIARAETLLLQTASSSTATLQEEALPSEPVRQRRSKPDIVTYDHPINPLTRSASPWDASHRLLAWKLLTSLWIETASRET